ncbi:ABC transporter substrate-binding protein [Phytohabitans rumicis]|uniref:ABC transporter substrate-binding protein n=1 Tax=Phytohabitans rumicis TaxID=1076125 RepID=A0A6V8L3B5_9ACTN|nr:ABC transporter substrate-binding protein [Phytohabitans rumicis]GFJ90654.1 ABC transporter substrate-binding protein [Phytohabitans rumicis]
MSPLDRRQALKLFAALGAAGFAAACATDDDADADPQLSDEPVKIGLVAPQTGSLKVVGDDIVNGFQLYLALNQNRLGGHPVELVTADEGGDDKSAKAAIDSLLQQGVLALTGVANSTALGAVRDTIEGAKVPLIASNGVPSSLQGVLYIWSASFVDSDPSQALGSYLTGVMPSGDRLTVIAPNSETGQDAVDTFRQAFGPTDSRLTETLWTQPSATASKNFFQATLAQVDTLKPDAVYAFYSGPVAVEFVKQFRARGLDAKIYAPGFFTDGTVLTEMGDEAEGIFTAMNYSSDLNNAANRLFATAYRREHDVAPSASAMASYDSAQVLDRAIRLAGGRPTPQQVNLMLGRVGQIDSPRGTWQFNQPRTPQQKWYLREVRQDGQVLSNVLLSELATLG